MAGSPASPAQRVWPRAGRVWGGLGRPPHTPSYSPLEPVYSPFHSPFYSPMHSCQHLATSVLKKKKENIYHFNSKSIDAPNAGRSALGYRMGHRMGYRMGYMRALMGYRRVCEVAFQQVRFENAALRGRAGIRVDSGFGRVGWAGTDAASRTLPYLECLILQRGRS